MTPAVETGRGEKKADDSMDQKTGAKALKGKTKRVQEKVQIFLRNQDQGGRAGNTLGTMNDKAT